MPDETTRIVDLPIKTNVEISLADYLMGIDAAEGYQMLISDLAKKIVEDYTGSNIAGSAQALKTAIGNITMGTTATTLTGAIAEHESDITTLNSNTKLIIKRYTASATGIAAGDIVGLSGNNFSVSTPTGYTPVAVLSFSTGNATGSVYQVSAEATGTGRMMSIRNVGSSSSDYSPSIVILYAKTGMIV